MDSKELRGLMEAYSEVYAPQEEIDEADSLAAMQARREKRLKAQRKREGTTAAGNDLGHDYSLTPAQQKARRDAEFKAGMKKEEVEQYVDFLIDEGYDCSELTWEEIVEEYESLDEGLRSAVKRLFGKKDKPAEEKPMSRGDQLRKKYNVGPEKSDTSAKRQILNRTRARAERDERDYGNSKYSKSVAQKSKEAHDRYLRGGYSKYGADDRRGSGNKARRRAAALKNEEFDVFDVVLEFLQAEGYVETLEEAEWMMANLIDEEAVDIILSEADSVAKMRERSAKRRQQRYGKQGGGGYDYYKPLTQADYERGEKNDPRKKSTNEEYVDEAEYVKFNDGRKSRVTKMRGEFKKPQPLTPLPKSTKKSGMEKLEKGRQAYNKSREVASRNLMRQEEFEAWLDEAMTNYEKNRKRAAQRAAARNAARDAGKTGVVPGVGYVSPRRERETWTDESGKTRHAKGL
jgi:hypothetical protein